MRVRAENRRRTQLEVESLEGKTLLSTGSVMHHVAANMMTAPMVAQDAAFSGTLSGSYGNVNAPGFGHTLSYATSGTLSGPGATRLRGTLILRGRARPGRLVGALLMRNSGGRMIVDVFRSTTVGDYTYRVARARGSDTVFLGGSGNLMITQTPPSAYRSPSSAMRP
jgi:hypothetical protein